MLAMAESLPIHVISGPDLIARYMKETPPELRRGDAFLHNSPYHGNSHAADCCVLVPVIDDDGAPSLHGGGQGAPGRLRQLGADDLRGRRPRRLRGGRADLPVRQGAGGLRRRRGRHADVRACGSACRSSGAATTSPCSAPPGSASGGCSSSLGEVGWDALEDYARDWFDYSEQRMMAAIRRMPAGTVVLEAATTRSRAARRDAGQGDGAVSPEARRSRSTCATTPTASRAGSTSPRRRRGRPR